jgi:hypothetical protein
MNTRICQTKTDFLRLAFKGYLIEWKNPQLVNHLPMFYEDFIARSIASFEILLRRKRYRKKYIISGAFISYLQISQAGEKKFSWLKDLLFSA